jgi:hypothetical protein
MTRAVRNDEAGAIIGEDRGRGDRVALAINDLLDPLDVLIMQGQDIVERLRRVPIRPIAELGDSAERVRSALTKLATLLTDVAGAIADGEMAAANDLELPALIDVILRNAIDKAGGRQEDVDLQLTSLPNGLIWIALEGTETGRLEKFDLWDVFDAAKRELGSLGLAVAGQIVTAHGGRILVRSTRPRDSRADLNVRSDTG